MNRVVKILMERDGMTEKEAQQEMEFCREELEEGNWEALQDCLGLEDDYIFDVLY